MKRVQLVREETEITSGKEIIGKEKRDDATALYSLIQAANYKEKSINDSIREVIKAKKLIIDAITNDKKYVDFEESVLKALKNVCDAVTNDKDSRIPLGVAVAILQLEDAETIKQSK